LRSAQPDPLRLTRPPIGGRYRNVHFSVID
jgi:hypothetical protein